MKRKPINSKSPVGVRGKYAAAFKKGVRVVVHTKTGDQVRVLKRDADGAIVWKYPPTKTRGTA